MGKYYVVWIGREPGVYATWEECQRQVDGYSGALFRSFDSPEAAGRAWDADPGDADPFAPDEPEPERVAGAMGSPVMAARARGAPDFPATAIAVDAACAGNPGPMEYRGVELQRGQELFRVGPMMGTNNVGEFLAIVHGLAWLSANEVPGPLFTDSKVAMGWVQRRRVGTTLSRRGATEEVWALLDRALGWLRRTPVHARVLKWPTRRWGEIPADFGRK